MTGKENVMSCTTMPNTAMDATSVKPRAFRRASISWALVASLCASSLVTAAPVRAQSLNAAAAPLAGPFTAPVIEVQGPPRGGWGGPPPRGGHYGRPGGPPPRGYYGRPPPGAWQGPPPPRHARWGYPYWRNGGWYYRNNNNGAWIAAGIAGLALGAAAASAMRNNNNANNADIVAYCARKFRSYNPRTGTYTGYDGLQHPCP